MSFLTRATAALLLLLSPLLASAHPRLPTAARSPFTSFSPPTRDGFVSVPPAADASVDCALKAFAAQFAAYLQPAGWPHASNWTSEVVAALQLPSLCGQSEGDVAPPPFTRPSTIPARATAPPACDWTRFVDGLYGQQSNNGTQAHPWKDVSYAVSQSRTRPTTLTRACIYVRGGSEYPPHYFGDHQEQFGRAYESQRGAIALTASDSNLTIAAYQGEQVTFSGGVALDLSWSVHAKTEAGTIMKARLPDGVAVDWDHFNELYIDEWRAVRAKFPNGDPFLYSRVTQPTGYVDGAASWLAPDSTIPPATEIHVSQPVPRSQEYFPQFQIGVEGTVRDMDPPRSYWALAAPPGGGGSTYIIPRGFVWNEQFSPRAANWSNPTTGRVFTFHGESWGSWQYEIAAVHPENKTLVFGRGGWQEARGAQTGGSMYVHNIWEELDDANEFFVDADTRTLYFMANASAMPGRFIASQIPCILSAQGTRQAPVEAVTISGITFSHTSNSFLRKYETPSGGDYTVHRGGAVVLQGTSDVVIAGNTFEHLGSNALVVSNYNLNATIIWNQFRWLGESAVVLVGQSDGVNGVTNYEQPTHTHIESNLAHDFCVYVKQGDAIFEALVRSSVWAGNLAYNAPRSIFNKNDGFAGGLDAYQNLLFNANRETGDHGPINTWDREPFLTEEGGSGPSLVAKTNRIHNNFLVNDYGSDMGVDHDDGSAFYLDSYNFMQYSGTKNYLGHSKVNDHQIFAYSDVHPGYGSLTLTH